MGHDEMKLNAMSPRRLLYVACTRAQGMLYLTHTTTRMIAGESLPQEVSPFVAAVRSNPKVGAVCGYLDLHLADFLDEKCFLRGAVAVDATRPHYSIKSLASPSSRRC